MSEDRKAFEAWWAQSGFTKYKETAEAAYEAGRRDPSIRQAAWQPIETAPRVATRILGLVEGVPRFICYGKTSHVPMYGWILTDQGPEDCELCEPTLWMPLPAAASQVAQEDGKP